MDLWDKYLTSVWKLHGEKELMQGKYKNFTFHLNVPCMQVHYDINLMILLLFNELVKLTINFYYFIRTEI